MDLDSRIKLTEDELRSYEVIAINEVSRYLAVFMAFG